MICVYVTHTSARTHARHTHAHTGRKENAAIDLLAATPDLNVMHALYIFSVMPCLADLAAAIVQVLCTRQNTRARALALG